MEAVGKMTGWGGRNNITTDKGGLYDLDFRSQHCHTDIFLQSKSFHVTKEWPEACISRQTCAMQYVCLEIKSTTTNTPLS